MSKIKKYLSIILSVAMVLSCITTGSAVKAAETTASSWTSEAIISPEQNKLVGAGYIDIEWNNTLENVKQYKVYVDGVLKKTVSPGGSTMTYEFYTTKVRGYNAQIIAELKDGTTVKSAVRKFYVTKKGICVNEKDMGVAVDPASMNIGWYYNWGYKSFKDTNFKNTKFYDTEFVPMLWGDNPVSIAERCEYANSKGYKYMLAYNEPDLQWEANKQPATMRLRWNEMVNSKGSLRLGSPATETFQINSDKWWTPFWNGLTSAQKSNMTFIAVHAYQHYYDNADTALQYLHTIDEIYAKYKKPIWVTEFAVADTYNKFSPTNAKQNAQVREFMKIVLKGLNERSYVERYSWFSFNSKDDTTGASGLFDYDTGKLTTLGQIYANIGNPAGYSSKTYNVSYTTSKSTSISACTAAVPTTLYSLTAKKKSFKYSIKSVQRASGYQLQYSLSKKFSKKKKFKTKTKNISATSASVKNGTIKKLQKKKTYYVRVRAYKVIDGKKYYCKWSAKKKVKIKK